MLFRDILLFASGGVYSGNLGFTADGIHKTSLTDLATYVNANPGATVVQLGPYNAAVDGVFTTSPITTTYTGTFDGAGYTIGSLTITNTSFTTSSIGLFSIVGAAATVKNLTVGGTITQTQWQTQTADGLGRFLLGDSVGAICGQLNGTLDNCHTTAIVSCAAAGGRHGGLVGAAGGTARQINCTSSASISLSPNCYNAYLSSLCAYNQGFMSGCVNAGTSLAPSGTSLYPATNGQIATFTGSITGTTLTITNLIAGVVATNQFVYSGGDGSGVIYGTKITSGSGATWTVDTSQTTGSLDMVTGAGGPYLTTGAWQGGVFGANGLTSAGTGVMFTGDTHGTTTIDNIADTSDIAQGEYVAGDGIPNLATVVTVNANSIVISAAATATTAGVTFRAATAYVYACSSSGTQTGSNNPNAANYTGGLGGINLFGVVDLSSSSSTVTSASSVGCFVGRQYGPTSLCQRSFATGPVTGMSTTGRVGGFVGENWGTTDQCYATGNVSGAGPSVGAFIGTNIDNIGHDCTVTNCFAFGSVTGTIQVGGCIGNNQGIVDSVYSAGPPIGGAAVGGFIGADAYEPGVTNTYWNTTRSGTSRGVGNVSVPTGTTGQTTAQLVAGLPAGFGAKWTRDGAGIIAGGYPYLVNVTAPAAPLPINPPVIIILTTTGGANWTVPSDWNNSSNQVHCIGAGGNGGDAITTQSSRGGGSGAYATNINITLTPGASIPYTIGAGGSAVASNFNSGLIIAAAGTSGTLVVTGVGGSVANSTGTIRSAGANGNVNTGGVAGGGGGGAAGPIGVGKGGGGGSGTSTNSGGGGGGGNGGGTAATGGTSAGGGTGGDSSDGISLGGAGSTVNTVDGGTGINGAGGGGGFANSTLGSKGGGGGPGSVWAGAGPGGGGGGGAGLSTVLIGGNGGAGGLYGAGGGGGGRGNPTPGVGGAGAQGVIVVIYTPA